MLASSAFIIETDAGIREILITPFILQWKTVPNIKAGKITKLFFYENWIDEEYKQNLKLEHLPEDFKTDKYIINYGQDFNKFYLGCLGVDFDNMKCWNEEEQQKVSESDFQLLSYALFDEDVKRRQIIVFTPTRPSDINLGYYSDGF